MERKNWSIIDYVMAMIHHHEFPMFIWEEACNIKIYVKNRSPHRILGEKTPMEVFSEVNPKI
jgi:hypothetical protein